MRLRVVLRGGRIALRVGTHRSGAVVGTREQRTNAPSHSWGAATRIRERHRNSAGEWHAHEIAETGKQFSGAAALI